MSSGMMEVARSGIFVPGQFTFHAVMVVFLAVMVADVILLDVFNTLGLPTSTTVSVVFELLGAATVVAVLSTATAGAPLADVAHFINGAGALRIVTGILLSVGIAFSAGLVGQWLFRLVFTFELAKASPWLRRAWAGLSMALLGYFLVVKGLKSAQLLPDAAMAVLSKEPALVLLGAAFVGTLVATALQVLARVDPLRVTVLAGTFALATAFASNDLVNFIGVPLAGLSAHEAWRASGLSTDVLRMDALAAPVAGQLWLLVGAGGVMVATLHLSSKARSVTETEVSLGRQAHGEERFQPGPVSRGLVSAWLWVHSVVKALTPGAVQGFVGRRFALPPAPPPTADAPAFDLLRASVNLTVASSVMVVGTAMKLPLSTTFVTFMVAMGSSLADRSWGRDAAVYRVAGVGRVLAGWFVTAALAAFLAGAVAVLLWLFGGVGLAAVVSFAVVALVWSTRWHRRQVALRRQRAVDAEAPQARLLRVLRAVAAVLTRCEAALRTGRARGLARAAHDERQLASELEVAAMTDARHLPADARLDTLRLKRRERELVEAAAHLAERIAGHLSNLHEPFTPAQQERVTRAVAGIAARALEGADFVAKGTPALDPRAALAVDRRALQQAERDELASFDGDEAPPRRASVLVLLALRELERLTLSLEDVLGVEVPGGPAVRPPPQSAPPRDEVRPSALSTPSGAPG